MKIHCPHCGVKGSADDSYQGQRVKCPKCNTIFDASPKATLSPIAEELPIQPIEDEISTASPVDKKQTVGWPAFAPKIKLQWAENLKKTTTSKITESVSTSPASPDEPSDVEAFEDSAVPEELEEIVVTDPSLEEKEQEKTFDAEAVDDATTEIDENGDIEIIDEPEPIDKTDDILYKPYGIEKEQCWQCGKKDSFGEPFIAQNGRLYCTDCVPAEELVEIDETDGETTGPELVKSCAIKGFDAAENKPADSFAKLTVGGALREAWANTKGTKASIWAGSAVMYLTLLVLLAGGAYLLPSLMSENPPSVTSILTTVLFQSVTEIVSVIFIAGLFYMGIRKIARDTLSWKMIFKGFSYTGTIIIACVLQAVVITIGFLLLILPGIYLSIGYLMTVPLIVDKGLSPWQAMEASRKAIHKVWWKVAGLFLLMGFILFLSMIPLCIGLIWSWPMFVILIGVIYRYLFGVKKISN